MELKYISNKVDSKTNNFRVVTLAMPKNIIEEKSDVFSRLFNGLASLRIANDWLNKLNRLTEAGVDTEEEDRRYSAYLTATKEVVNFATAEKPTEYTTNDRNIVLNLVYAVFGFPKVDKDTKILGFNLLDACLGRALEARRTGAKIDYKEFGEAFNHFINIRFAVTADDGTTLFKKCHADVNNKVLLEALSTIADEYKWDSKGINRKSLNKFKVARQMLLVGLRHEFKFATEDFIQYI